MGGGEDAHNWKRRRMKLLQKRPTPAGWPWGSTCLATAHMPSLPTPTTTYYYYYWMLQKCYSHC
jgi:hypothetical protein